jgi:hypothetical protein
VGLYIKTSICLENGSHYHFCQLQLPYCHHYYPLLQQSSCHAGVAATFQKLKPPDSSRTVFLFKNIQWSVCLSGNKNLTTSQKNMQFHVHLSDKCYQLSPGQEHWTDIRSHFICMLLLHETNVYDGDKLSVNWAALHPLADNGIVWQENKFFDHDWFCAMEESAMLPFKIIRTRHSPVL